MLQHTIFKLIQRKTYTCLSHKFGIYFAYSGLIIILYAVFHFGEEVLEWSRYQYEVTFTIYHHNIVSQSYQHQLCSELPIDAVYTWVNGSDPSFLLQLRKHKRSQNNSSKVEESSCMLSDCFQLPLVIVSPKISNTSLQRNWTLLNSNLIANSSVLKFFSLKEAREFVHNFNSSVQSVSKFYVTSDSTASKSIPHMLLIKSLPATIKTNSDLLQNLPAPLQGKVDWLFVNIQHQAAIVYIPEKVVLENLMADKMNTSIANDLQISGKKISLHYAHFTKISSSGGLEDDLSKNRFEDNEELRYSLRSLEKYAPWIRHVYIVTNGQIPYWLDVDSPHLTVISHEEIFPNKSHLPTFSSPAIEVHLHRIPGLSRRFIYFNDDVMFGKEVWPDDFFSQTLGQKVYLTWPVPNCAEGCAPSWITDGYCDAACNVSDCNWDGGDCTGDNIRPGVGLGNSFGGGQWQPSFVHYCRPGCSNTWLADRFCDQACNHIECGFDVGDCGLSNYDKLHQFDSTILNGSIYRLPDGNNVGYFDLKEVFSKVTSAQYEKNECIRVATASNKFHVLTIMFDSTCNHTETRIEVRGLSKQNVSEFYEVTVQAFPSKNDSNISVAETKPAPTSTSPPEDEKIFDLVVKEVPNHLRLPPVVKRNNSISSPLGDVDINALPSHLKNKADRINARFKQGHLTEVGRQQLLRQLLNETSSFNISKHSVGELDGHSHEKGDPGVQSKNETKIDLQFLMGPDRIKLRKLTSIEEENELNGHRGVNATDTDQQVTELKPIRFRNRRLLDVFGDSLRYVSKLYNDRFGFTQRKVPAHMPHMIDRDIMEELQGKFPHEFDVTSSHRFRHSKDMQFAFSYFYYLMSEEKPANFSEIFDMFDTDTSGLLSDRELRLLASKIFELPLTLQDLTSIEEALKQCAIELYAVKQMGNSTLIKQPLDGVETTESYYDKDMPQVTRQLLLNCSFITTKLNKTLAGKKKFNYMEMDQSEVTFKMLRDNVSTVVGQLDDIRKKPTKFICLNDNIDHNSPGVATVRAVLHDFYETFFPVQSQFELPYEYRNRFDNLADLRAWKKSRQRTLRILQALLVLLFICVLVSLFGDRLSRFWRRHRYSFKRNLKCFATTKLGNPV